MIETNLIEDFEILKPPGSLGWLVWLLGAVLLAVVLAVWKSGRTAHPVPPHAGPGNLAPWDAALLELERLGTELSSERSREYGMAATAVLRGYVEARYGWRAPQLATEEFLVVAAGSSQLPMAHRQVLARFLTTGDLFKFGRFLASMNELNELHAAAIAFVLASRPAPVASTGEAP